MPKVDGTRRQRAVELLSRLESGPSLGWRGQKMTPEEYTDGYQLWVNTWVIRELIDLVPELKKLRKQMEQHEEEQH